MQDNMIIKGARQHNLKNINLEIPRNKLVVITGVSGSGKSSLAFDTIYAEGQRRYVESLSAYARQFLGKMDKPDVDYIEGLSPAISIDQKTAGRNPRSTVGTVTEIYDYLRLLFARAGEPHCPKCGRLIERQTPQQIVDQVLALPEETKFIIMAPLVYGRKGEHKDILDNMRSAGYVRVLVDGAIRTLDEDIRLDKKKKHRISVVIDRMKVRDGIRQRLSDSVETALKLSDGLVEILLPGTGKNGGPDEVRVYSERFACPDCGISLPEIEPRLFSFNAPYGACPTCGGLGVNMEYDWDRIMPDKEKSFRDGAIDVKGVLADRAVKIFRGTIDFRNGSAGSVGDEQEDVLLLDEDVINKTVPVILCEEEDVDGRHGASIGRLSEDILFYLATRGIGEKEAQRLMLRGRLAGIARAIPDEETVKLIDAAIDRYGSDGESD
ncbi:MAG TPA: hypothetical protein DHV71_05810 [Acidaminococcaceae bacterium]|nr:hypothetical protein [Acidaminococcaceae bacterium]